jgi:D-ribose pyranose/furanose isomerase RbsD
VRIEPEPIAQPDLKRLLDQAMTQGTINTLDVLVNTIHDMEVEGAGLAEVCEVIAGLRVKAWQEMAALRQPQR